MRLNDDVEMRACAVHVQVNRISASACLFLLPLFVLGRYSTVRASGVVIGAPFTYEVTRASGLLHRPCFQPTSGLSMMDVGGICICLHLEDAMVIILDSIGYRDRVRR